MVARLARPRGFTLVEVLVAMFVMALLAALAWRGVDGIVRSRDISQARLEQALRLNTVMAQWAIDLEAVQDTAVVPAFAFDGATLRLTRRATGGIQLVVWSLRPGSAGAQGGSTWWRWAGTATTRVADLQDTWLRSQQFQGGEAGQLRALTGITQWQLYCFRGSAWSNCQSSADVALPAAGASAPVRMLLPSGVRLVLGFVEGQGLAGTLTRDLMLAPQMP